MGCPQLRKNTIWARGTPLSGGADADVSGTATDSHRVQTNGAAVGPSAGKLAPGAIAGIVVVSPAVSVTWTHHHLILLETTLLPGSWVCPVVCMALHLIECAGMHKNVAPGCGMLQSVLQPDTLPHILRNAV